MSKRFASITNFDKRKYKCNPSTWKCEELSYSVDNHDKGSYDDLKECNRSCNSLNLLPSAITINNISQYLNYPEMNYLNQSNTFLRRLVPILKTAESGTETKITIQNRNYLKHQVEQKLLRSVFPAWDENKLEDLKQAIAIVEKTISQINEANIIISPRSS